MGVPVWMVWGRQLLIGGADDHVELDLGVRDAHWGTCDGQSRVGIVGAAHEVRDQRLC